MGIYARSRDIALVCCVFFAICLGVASCSRGKLQLADSGQFPDKGRTVSNKDIDLDGLPDSTELAFGTDPNNIDSDGDGLTDQFELWGQRGVPIGVAGPSENLPDPNLNGINAALDPRELAGKILSARTASALEDKRVRVLTPGTVDTYENDLDGDYIPTDFELAGFYYEIDPQTSEDWFVKWDGDPSRNYYKTDPTKWSTDADPWSDWEEATKRNLDQRLKHPGDHPCIPAYPDIQGVLTAYSVEDARDITSSNGRKTESSWTNTVASTSSSESNWSAEGSVEGTLILGTETGGAGKIEVSGTLGGSTTSESETTNDASGLSVSEWSTVTAGDTIESAKLTLNLKVINVGTMPASEARALFNLKLGDFLINSFLVNLTGEAGFGELKGNAQNPVDVIIRNNGRGTEGLPPVELFLSLPQVQSLHLGAPLTIEPVSFEAQTLVSERDPDSGRRINLNIGNWSPYRSAIQTSTARVILDMGPDPNGTVLFGGLPPRRTLEARVFAYDNTGNYVGSPPVITLRDAFVWAFGAEDSPFGPTVNVDDPISNQKITALLENYDFGFDPETFAELKADPNFDNVFDLPLKPSNPLERVYIAKAPPEVDLSQSIDRSKPRVLWATLDPYRQVRIAVNRPLHIFGTEAIADPPIMVFDHYEYRPEFEPVVRAYVDDIFKVSEVRFKPTPDSIGQQMVVGNDPDEPMAGQAYEYQLPDNYVWTGYETVAARNKDGHWSEPRPIFLQEGSHYNREGKLELGWVSKDGRVDGIADTNSDRSRLVDNDINFNDELVREGDVIVLPFPRNLIVRVSEVLGDHVLAVKTSSWANAADGTAAPTAGFTPPDTYILYPSGKRFESLGTFVGELGKSSIKPSERNATTKKGSYGFNFSKPDDVRGGPPDITIEEDWSGATVVRKLKVNAAIGADAIGQVGWGVVNYELIRKANFSRNEIDLSAAQSEQYVYLVRAANGRYGKLRFFYENNPDAPGQLRIYAAQFEIYRGI